MGNKIRSVIGAHKIAWPEGFASLSGPSPLPECLSNCRGWLLHKLANIFNEYLEIILGLWGNFLFGKVSVFLTPPLQKLGLFIAEIDGLFDSFGKHESLPSPFIPGTFSFNYKNRHHIPIYSNRRRPDKRCLGRAFRVAGNKIPTKNPRFPGQKWKSRPAPSKAPPPLFRFKK